MPRMLPLTATHCKTLHCNILHLQHIVIYYITLQQTATPGADILHHTATPRAAGRIIVYSKDATATHCITLQHPAIHCNNRGCRRAFPCMPKMSLQHTATHYNTRGSRRASSYMPKMPLQHTVTHYNALQHTATTGAAGAHHRVCQGCPHSRARRIAVAGTCCSVLTCVAVCCTHSHARRCCSVLQCIALC